MAGLAGITLLAGATGTAAQLEDGHFKDPRYRNMRIDHCMTVAEESCGQPVADQFCQMHGYARAESFETREHAELMVRLGDKQDMCRKYMCTALYQVQCAGSASGS